MTSEKMNTHDIMKKIIAAEGGPGIHIMDIYDRLRNQQTISKYFLKYCGRAIELFGEYNIDFMLYATEVVGPNGRVYPISNLEYLKNPDHAFAMFIDTFRKFKEDYCELGVVCDGCTSDIYKIMKKDGKHLRKIEQLLGKYLRADAPPRGSDEYRSDEKEFYAQMGIVIPEQREVPPFPEEIKKGSINLIVEQNFFTQQHDKPALLAACDEMLVSGGHLVFREHLPSSIEEVQRAVANSLPKYTESGMPEIKANEHWIAYRKEKRVK